MEAEGLTLQGQEAGGEEGECGFQGYKTIIENSLKF